MRHLIVKFCANKFEKPKKEPDNSGKIRDKNDIRAFVDSRLTKIITDVLGDLQDAQFSAVAALNLSPPDDGQLNTPNKPKD